MGICRVFRSLAAVAVLAATVQVAEAANYPLELTNIGPVGTRGMSANNRIFRAYPGLVYNIRAAVVGGATPFTFALTNAPEGMSIDSAGEITWANPQASATPTISVTDAEGTRVTATWTINVTTSGFKFVDATNGRAAANNGCASSCGSGTLASPWRSLTDLMLNDAGSDITYFRAGVYNVSQVPSSFRQSIGSVWERVVVSESGSTAGSVIWLGYPNETPVFDLACGSCASGLLIRHAGDSVYMDGLEVRNPAIIGFQFEADGAYRGPTYRNLRMHDLTRGGDGTNAAFIMTTSSYPQVSYGMVLQDSTFWNVPANAVTVKTYSLSKPLIENTVHYNADVALELKADTRQFTVRANHLFNISRTAIGGNMHGCAGCSGGADLSTTRGEILFNLVQAGNATALELNQDGQALEVYVSRNTLIGRVTVRNADGADGPFYFYRNVIVNEDNGTPAGSHVYHLSVSAPGRVSHIENLVGYASTNIVDTAGNLTGGYASFIGSRGYQGGGGGTFSLPGAVRGLRIMTGGL